MNQTERNSFGSDAPSPLPISASSGFAVRATAVTAKLTISMISPGVAKPNLALWVSWNKVHSFAVVAAAKRSMVSGNSSS